jgi:hypothetical protein
MLSIAAYRRFYEQHEFWALVIRPCTPFLPLALRSKRYATPACLKIPKAVPVPEVTQ